MRSADAATQLSGGWWRTRRTLERARPATAGVRRKIVRRLLRLRVWVGERLQPTPWQTTLFWAAVVGVLGALGSIAFRIATEGFHELLTRSDAAVVESFRAMPWWARLVIPAIGGLIAGAVLMWGRRVLKDQVSTDYMEAIAIGSGQVPVRASLFKIGAAVFSIGSGGSIGREGPMVQLSAVAASRLGRWWSFSPPQLRLIVACGAAAGITSAYNAPIAGAFFVAEIILGSIAMDSLGPLVVASVAASLTMRGLTDVHRLYEVPPFTVVSAWEMGPYLVLGLLAGALAPVFLRSLHRAERLFAAQPWPAAVKLALGGLIVGALAIRVPEVCGNGYSVVLDILNGHIAWELLLLVMVGKWIATGASFGSGAAGGVFTPSLFMGAAIGQLFGTAVHHLWPVGAADPRAFALVGMGAFLSAATHAPVMAVIMLFEMTLSYDIILPLMTCNVIAYFVAKGIEDRSIYSEALERKEAEEPAPDPRSARVAQLVKPDPPQVGVHARFAEIARMFLSVRVNNLYVIDEEKKFLGAVSLHDIKPYLNDADLAEVVIAADIIRADLPTVTPDQSLDEALGLFLHADAERLPVISSDRALLGSLAKTDLLLALEEKLRRELRS